MRELVLYKNGFIIIIIIIMITDIWTGSNIISVWAFYL